MLMPLERPLLILAIGNELRSDDAAGRRVVEIVDSWNLPDVKTVCDRQLSPEMAAVLAEFRSVILVDARMGDSDVPSVNSVSKATLTGSLSHSLSPGELLALARTLNGYAPAMWTLGIPASNFEHGVDLSPRCQKGIAESALLLTAWLRAGTRCAFTGGCRVSVQSETEEVR